MEEFGRDCGKRKQKVNVGKSKVVKFILSGEQEHIRVRLGSEEVEDVSEFKYLRSMLSVDGGQDQLKHRLGEGCWFEEKRRKDG